MPTIYCANCGGATKYSFQKPEECSNCSQAFASIKPKVTRKYLEEIEEEDDFDEPLVRTIRKKDRKMKGFRVEVEHDGPVKIGELQGSSEGRGPRRRPMSKEEFINKRIKAPPSTIGGDGE